LWRQLEYSPFLEYMAETIDKNTIPCSFDRGDSQSVRPSKSFGLTNPESMIDFIVNLLL
jgi:hypothetical protein